MTRRAVTHRIRALNPNPAENLCTSCGLCCNGSFFSEVELMNARESVSAESLGLRVDDDGEFLMQPCCALQGTRCSVYRFRPNCCRTFECRLLQNLRGGKVTLTQAQAVVRETKEMIANVSAHLGGAMKQTRLPLKERYFAAMEKPGTNHAKLMVAMELLETRIQDAFLR